jgi:hypothetical protein
MTRAASLIGSFLSTLFAAPFQSVQDLSTYRRSRPRISVDMGLRHVGTDGAWENEEGLPCEPRSPKLGATRPHVPWAEPIEVRANARFNGKKAVESVGRKQDAGDRINTHAALAIPENKPAGITAADEAGYIIHEWQVLRDQARRMIT